MPTRTKIVICGATGRMGQTVARLAMSEPDRYEVLGGIDQSAAERDSEGLTLASVEDAGTLLSAADVVIDFSAPPLLTALLERQREALRGKALVVGTTGLGSEVTGRLDAAAATSPVLVAANFSVGVNLLIALAAQAARVLSEGVDVEIIEAHHRRKEDAPSGTALALGEAIAGARGVDLAAQRRDGRSGRPGKRTRDEIGFHAVRGGEVIGEHQVLFIGDLERIELVHRAGDRALFAAGALRAAGWIAGRASGRYTMNDVLGFG